MIEVLIDYDKFQQNGINTIPEGAAYSRHWSGEYREWDNIEVREENPSSSLCCNRIPCCLL